MAFMIIMLHCNCKNCFYTYSRHAFKTISLHQGTICASINRSQSFYGSLSTDQIRKTSASWSFICFHKSFTVRTYWTKILSYNIPKIPEYNEVLRYLIVKINIWSFHLCAVDIHPFIMCIWHQYFFCTYINIYKP